MRKRERDTHRAEHREGQHSSREREKDNWAKGKCEGRREGDIDRNMLAEVYMSE